MSEPRKNHYSVDGGQVIEEENVASYQPIIEEPEFKSSSKGNLSKSKEKLAGDGAEEKLLQNQDQGKITTRVDMADAKYVVGDHRNGDAKVELDANKKQFSGLTKEELLKYADDPFWVRLRWVMFILFWTLWVCMLAGAIAIIVYAPTCVPPAPKKWFEKGPLVDLSDASNFQEIKDNFKLLQSAKTKGVFISGDLIGETYDVLDEGNADLLSEFKTFANSAKEFGLRVIVDLTANYVPITHRWFSLSENKTAQYVDYFVWKKGTDFTDTDKPQRRPPNNWLSTANESAWTESQQRGEFYLHQYGVEQPDLNFNNVEVVKHFDDVIVKWMQAGAAGVRLLKARRLLVDLSQNVEHAYKQDKYIADQPGLDDLLQHWAHLVDTNAKEDPSTESTVFTMREQGDIQVEMWLLGRNWSSLRPPSAIPINVDSSIENVAKHINKSMERWPALQLTSANDSGAEVAALALLLPATPVLLPSQLGEQNITEWLQQLLELRDDASIKYGQTSVLVVPAVNSTDKLLACARWKTGHSGYAAVWNPGTQTARANLTLVPSLPPSLTVHQVSKAVQELTNYTSHYLVERDEVIVPPKSTIILSYVPDIEQ